MGTSNSFIPNWEFHFLQHRPFLVAFAFRMTGSLSEAEDLVQDTFLGCANVDPATIDNHKSWLTKVCSNKGLDHLKVAYKKRESYTGTWLPDAVPDGLQIWESLNEGASPEQNILFSESLTTSFLLLIEKLTPEERVVYLLSEVFEYSFKEISGYLAKTEEACRKIAQRARTAVTSDRVKFNSDKSTSQNLIAQFFDFAKKGDRAGMESLLAEDSQFWSDGGGKVPAALFIIKDRFKTAHFFKMLSGSEPFTSGEYKMEPKMVNLRPGWIISKQQPTGEWTFETIMSFEIKEGRIARIYAQRNPEKFVALTNSKAASSSQ